MSKQYLTTSWGSLAAGVAMLLAIALPAIIRLVNKIGLGLALGLITLGLFISAWIITAIILIVRGLNKM